MENNETTQVKDEFNFANLPFLLSVGVFIYLVILYTFFNVFGFIISLFMLSFYLFLIYIACPVSLIFQILHKNKTLIDKILLALNAIMTAFVISCAIFVSFILPNNFHNPNFINNHIFQEQKMPAGHNFLVHYLENYKKENNVYPENIDEKVLRKLKKNAKIKYTTTDDKNGYSLEIHPNNNTSEYYFHNERSEGNPELLKKFDDEFFNDPFFKF